MCEVTINNLLNWRKEEKEKERRTKVSKKEIKEEQLMSLKYNFVFIMAIQQFISW